MTEEQRWDYILQLDEKLLLGGVMLSEWTTFLVKDAETAFCSGAYLSSILACQAAVESHLRYEHSIPSRIKARSFYSLIENSKLEKSLKTDLHELRRYRNRWVHVNDPDNDRDLLDKPSYYEKELAEFAKKTISTMLRTIYSNPMV